MRTWNMTTQRPVLSVGSDTLLGSLFVPSGAWRQRSISSGSFPHVKMNLPWPGFKYGHKTCQKKKADGYTHHACKGWVKRCGPGVWKSEGPLLHCVYACVTPMCVYACVYVCMCVPHVRVLCKHVCMCACAAFAKVAPSFPLPCPLCACMYVCVCIQLCMCVCDCMHACVYIHKCVCERERDRERDRQRESVCVRERQRDRESVCVRESERERMTISFSKA